MISGAIRGAGGPALGRYLADAVHAQSYGLLAETIEDQVAELTRLGSHARTNQPIYHLHIDPPEGWGKEARDRYRQLFLSEFGLQGRPYVSATHDKNGRTHEHLVVLRVDEQGKAIRLDNDFQRREKISRIVEHEFGMPFTKGRHNRAVAYALERDGRPEIAEAIRHAGLTDGPPAIAKTTPEERHQQERTSIQKADVAAATSKAWAASDSPAAFIAAMRDQGMRIASGDKTTLVVDASGGSHSLARMLAMHARASGNPPPLAREINARMDGIGLPTLTEARHEIRAAAAAPPATTAEISSPVPGPPPAPSGGGQPAPSPEAGDRAGAEAPAPQQGGGRPVPAPSAGAGGGGGGGGAAAGAESPPAALDDCGPGPGEPPGPGAHPDEIARYRAACAAHEERQAKAIQAFARAWAASNERKQGGNHVGQESSGPSAEQQQQIREAIDRFSADLRAGIERAQARARFEREFARFIGDDAAPGRRNQGGEQPSTPERGGSSAGERRGCRDAAEDAGATRGPGADATPRPDRRGDGVDAGGRADRTEDRCEGQAFRDRCADQALRTSLSLTDTTALRAAVAALQPDPTEGMSPQERKAAIKEWSNDLYTTYRQDQEVSRDEGREVWRQRIAAERLRAEPVAQALRDGWRHMTADERSKGWAAIREARDRIKEELKSLPKPDFKSWLQHVAETDPRAAAVRADMLAGEERKARRREILSTEQARIDRARASEPKGERDPEVAARKAKEALTDRRTAADQAEKAAQDAREAVPWWGRLTGKGEPVRAANAAQAAAVEARSRAGGTLRGVADDAREQAKLNAAAHQGWLKRGGDGVLRDADVLQAVREAVADRDPSILKALDTGSYEAAAEIVRRRQEAEERERREHEQRAAREQRISPAVNAAHAAPEPGLPNPWKK